MNQINPIVIPRNHLVAEAIQDAVDDQNYSTFFNLLQALETPFSETSNQKYIEPALDSQRVTTTFCGT